VVSFHQFPHQNVTLTSPIHAICPAQLIFLDLFKRIIFGDEYRPLSSSLHNLRHSSVTSSLVGPNIFLSTPFLNTLSLRSSLNTRTKFHTHSTVSQLMKFRDNVDHKCAYKGMFGCKKLKIWRLPKRLRLYHTKVVLHCVSLPYTFT